MLTSGLLAGNASSQDLTPIPSDVTVTSLWRIPSVASRKVLPG